MANDIFLNTSTQKKPFIFAFNFQSSLFPNDTKASLFQVMAWRIFGAKPLPEAMMSYQVHGAITSPQ